MGFLIRAAIVIGIVAAYAPTAEGPVPTSGDQAGAVSSAWSQGVTAAQDLASVQGLAAVHGVALATDAARLLMSLPPETRSRVIESLTGATGTSRQAHPPVQPAASSLPILQLAPVPPARPSLR